MLTSIDEAVTGGTFLSSLIFLLQNKCQHFTKGTIYGHYEQRENITDASEALQHVTLVITHYALDPTITTTAQKTTTGIQKPSSEDDIKMKEEEEEALNNTRSKVPKNSIPVGRFHLRRRSIHKLSWKETLALQEMKPIYSHSNEPYSFPPVFLLVTECDSEIGLETVHYTLFNVKSNNISRSSTNTTSPSSAQPLPLHVDNMVSTAGDFEGLMNIYRRNRKYTSSCSHNSISSRTQEQGSATTSTTDASAFSKNKDPILDRLVSKTFQNFKSVDQEYMAEWQAVCQQRSEIIEELKIVEELEKKVAFHEQQKLLEGSVRKNESDSEDSSEA